MIRQWAVVPISSLRLILQLHVTLWCVHSNSTKAIEQARDCPSEITRLNTMLVKFLEDQMSRKKEKEPVNVSEDNCDGVSQVDMMPQISIRDPVVLPRKKGRPKIATRIKPPVELQGNKKKTCSYCHRLGHNITGCPKKKVFLVKIYLCICNISFKF